MIFSVGCLLAFSDVPAHLPRVATWKIYPIVGFSCGSIADAGEVRWQLVVSCVFGFLL